MSLVLPLEVGVAKIAICRGAVGDGVAVAHKHFTGVDTVDQDLAEEPVVLVPVIDLVAGDERDLSAVDERAQSLGGLFAPTL